MRVKLGGWDWSLSPSFGIPVVTVIKDVSSSPPGQAKVTVSYAIAMSDTDPLSIAGDDPGRTAPTSALPLPATGVLIPIPPAALNASDPYGYLQLFESASDNGGDCVPWDGGGAVGGPNPNVKPSVTFFARSTGVRRGLVCPITASGSFETTDMSVASADALVRQFAGIRASVLLQIAQTATPVSSDGDYPCSAVIDTKGVLHTWVDPNQTAVCSFE